MTIEEKREVLQNYCDVNESCHNCILDKYCVFINFRKDSPDQEIERAYNLLFGCKDEVNDNVNHPTHYQGKNECIDVMIAMFGKEAVKHFCMCNAYKYRFRADKKNGSEDIAKAEWYESKLIELGGVE